MENPQSYKYSQQPIVNSIQMRTAAMEPGKYLDITALVEQFNIYEDILNPFVSGDITIVDGISLINKLPIIGQERIVISYRSSFQENNIILELDVYRVSSVNENADDKNQVYTLYFASPEFIQDKKRKISQSFEEKHDVMVQNIYDNYLKTDSYNFSFSNGKPLNIPEPCEDIDRITIPNWSPIRSINFISRKSRSSRSVDESSYLFFERIGEGFYFIPLTSLGSKRAQAKYFRASVKYATNDGEKDTLLPILTIDKYVVDNDHNIIQSMNEGRYQASLNYYDMFTRTYGTNTYNIKSEFDKTRHVEKNVPTNERMISDFSSFVGNIIYVPHTENRLDDIVDYGKDVILKRNAQLSQFKSHGVRISVPGNSNLHAGDIVEIEIPSKDAPRNMSKGVDETVSGRYVVRSVRHQISQNNEYTSFVTLCRDSVLRPYPNNQEIVGLAENDSFVEES